MIFFFPGQTQERTNTFEFRSEFHLQLEFRSEFHLQQVEWASVLTAPAGLGTVDESGLSPLAEPEEAFFYSLTSLRLSHFSFCSSPLVIDGWQEMGLPLVGLGQKLALGTECKYGIPSAGI